MKHIRLIFVFFAFIFALTSTHSAFAGYITYTYNSKALPWDSTNLYHHMIDLEASPYDLDLPSFQFSFMVSDTLLSSTTTTRLGVFDPVVYVDAIWDKQLQTTSKGNITLNPDGSVAAWDIDLHLTQIMIPALADEIRALRYSLAIFTSGGETSCDCDLFRVRNNVLTQRPYNPYFIVGPMESIFSGTNSFSYWSVVRETDIKVVEPGMASLILIGLGLLGLRQIRRRKPDDLNRDTGNVTNKVLPQTPSLFPE